MDHPDFIEDTYQEDAQKMILGNLAFYVGILSIAGLAIGAIKRLF